MTLPTDLPTWKWPDRVTVDVETRTVAVDGAFVPVGYAMHMWGDPEAVWMTWLCGENRWWIDVAFYADGSIDGYMAGDAGVASRVTGLDEVLILWKLQGLRRDAPPADTDDEYGGDPYGYMEPGTWTGWETPRELTPAERKFVDDFMAELRSRRSA